MHLTDKNEISRWLICFCRFVKVIYKLILTCLIVYRHTFNTQRRNRSNGCLECGLHLACVKCFIKKFVSSRNVGVSFYGLTSNS